MDKIEIAGIIFLILAVPIGKLIGWIIVKQRDKNQK